MKNIGFLINPVAGMGGAVGLKGTDGQYDRAVALGAEPVAGIKARMMLEHLDTRGITFFTAGGSMGADALESAGVSDYHIVYTPTTPDTTADDTIKACRAIINSIQEETGTTIKADIPPDLIVFCGGDGTARDIFSVTGPDIPVLGVPAGVKMYSAVFAVNPVAAAELIQKFTPASCTDAEVMDVDEDAYRRGELSTRVYGIAQTPTLPNLRQSGKLVSVPGAGDDRRARREIAEFIPEIMRDDTLYILGAGTTTAAISEALGISGSTLLGVDGIYKGILIASDLNEEGILELLNRESDTQTNTSTHAPIHTHIHTYPRVKIILSPIGAQGFVLGRGNQQISPEVIRRVGHENIIVVATPAKLSRTPTLYIDTGDESLNACFGDSMQVICGYRMAQRVKLLHS